MFAEDAEVELDALIDTFGLSVRLRVEGCRQFGSSLEEIEYLLPEIGREGRSSVGDDVGR